jgi:hypothetical protein
MVVYLDKKEEVDRLLTKMTVEMANGECAFTKLFVQKLQPARYYRCHLYGYLHYCCKAPTPICGQYAFLATLLRLVLRLPSNAQYVKDYIKLLTQDAWSTAGN